MRTQKIKRSTHLRKPRLSRHQKIKRLCNKLDQLVTRAEKCGRDTKIRKTMMEQADVVREHLREIDH